MIASISFLFLCIFFFNDTATTEIYTLSLHDALPIWPMLPTPTKPSSVVSGDAAIVPPLPDRDRANGTGEDLRRLRSRPARSEEHTSELQSRQYLVCRLLLEKKNDTKETSLDIHKHMT